MYHFKINHFRNNHLKFHAWDRHNFWHKFMGDFLGRVFIVLASVYGAFVFWSYNFNKTSILGFNTILGVLACLLFVAGIRVLFID